MKNIGICVSHIWFLLLFGVGSIAHILLGCEVFIVGISLAVFAITYYQVNNIGVFNTASFVLVLVVFRYIGLPFFIKLLYGQPLDSNLGYPIESFNIFFLGFLGYILAINISLRLKVGKAILTSHNINLLWLSYLSGVVGLIANFLAIVEKSEAYDGTRIAVFFSYLVILAIISGTMYEIGKSNGKKYFNKWIAFLLLSVTAFAIANNQRMMLLDSLFAYILVPISVNGKITKRQIFLLGLLVMFLSVVTPIMLTVRQTAGRSWNERIELTMVMLENPSKAFRSYQDYRDLLNRGRYLYYYGEYENILQRVSYINDIDVIIQATSYGSGLGIDDVIHAFQNVLPRFLFQNKVTDASHGYWVLCEIDVVCGGKYPTLPLIGNGYAAYRWQGAFIYPFALTVFVLVLVKKMAGLVIYDNIFSIYFLIRVHNIMAEGDANQYISMALRIIPQDAFILLLLWSLAKLATMHQKKCECSNG